VLQTRERSQKKKGMKEICIPFKRSYCVITASKTCKKNRSIIILIKQFKLKVGRKQMRKLSKKGYNPNSA
jgi:hypothetical protein